MAGNLWRNSKAGSLAAACALLAPLAATAQEPTGPDGHWLGEAAQPREPSHTGFQKSARYVTTPEGVRLAVDVYLPGAAAPEARFPVIFVQTRYYRSAETVRDGLGGCQIPDPNHAFFLERGYAVVVADVRGTGASFGTRTAEFSSAEIADSAFLADWISRQSWSDGNVGLYGVSYPGTAAENMLIHNPPAVKAAAVISAGYDFYADINFPGGIKNTRFTSMWGMINAGLDAAGRGGIPLPPHVTAPCRVDEDPDGVLRDAAIAEHAGNGDSASQLAQAAFRDDPTGPEGWPSPYRLQDRVDASSIPLYSYVGWTDSAYAEGAIHRFRNTTSPVQRLTIGAVNHGGLFYYGPGVEGPTRSAFSRNAELLRFFDHYVRGEQNGFAQEPRLRYFMTGANVWRGSDAWPQDGSAQRLCLEPGGAISAACTASQSVDLVVSGDVATGNLTRWDTTLGATPVVYPDRDKAEALRFTTAPLSTSLDLVGAVSLDLEVQATGQDAGVFAILEDVDPQGRSRYVTEGQLRLSHSRNGPAPYRTDAPSQSHLRADRIEDVSTAPVRVQMKLLSTAHSFQPGHSLRLSLFSSDTSHMNDIPEADRVWRLSLDGSPRAHLVLPVAAGEQP